MSNKWTLIGSNSLETWSPSKKSDIKQTLALQRMKPNKMKKTFVKKDEVEQEDAGTR